MKVNQAYENLLQLPKPETGEGGGAGRPSRDMSTLCFRSLSSFLQLFLFFILSSIECQTNPAETSLQLPVSPHRMSLHQMSLLPSRLKYYLLCLSSSWFLKPTKFFKPTSCNFAVRIFSTMQRARESEGRRLAKKMMMPKRGFIFIFMQILLRTKTAISQKLVYFGTEASPQKRAVSDGVRPWLSGAVDICPCFNAFYCL